MPRTRARTAGLRDGAASFVRGCAVLLVVASPAAAGTFEVEWGVAPFTWAAGDFGPNTYTMTDQYGFELDITIGITASGGTTVAGYPDDLNGFGTSRSLWLVYDANAGNSGIGEATMTATMSLTSGGVAFGADDIEFVVADIDSVDNNGATDRCDFVTVTGNNGDPTLAYVSANAATRSVQIGGSGINGSGATGPLAANQAQCIYNLGTAGSNASNGDDNGSILATFPAGTSTASVAYDESIENVYGQTNRNAAARGVGAFAAVAVVVDDANAVALTKDADRTVYSASGETITYTYVVTNNSRLPFNDGQDIVIEDDVLGTVACPPIPAAGIAPGGTHTCTATYTVTGGDMSAISVDNVATAGVGTPGQAFADRLQSNDASESVERAAPSASLAKNQTSGPDPVTAAGQVIGYTILASNTGNVPLTGPSLADTLPNGAAGTPTFAGGDTDGDGAIDVGETWTYSISYTVTQADIDAGASLVNTASLDASELGAPVSGDETTGLTSSSSILLSKNVDDDSAVTAGQTLTYTYDVTNTGNQTLTGVAVADVHGGLGAAPVPGSETLLTDSGPTGDSTDGATDGSWDTLGPGDTVRFSATYTVTQGDIDELQ